MHPSTKLFPDLFKTEYIKLVAVLTKKFGLDHIELAEDIAMETFLQAMENWPYKGLPENPTAWLYVVAKNKVKNSFTRGQIFEEKIASKIKEDQVESENIDIDFSTKNITDSQLQMLFAICHPALAIESQICLALRVLCGLGITEIADAFLTNKETIHKRIQRAKEKLRAKKITIELPAQKDLPKRLDAVLQTIYLLFSEGYYSQSNPKIIQPECCVEAINLAYLLLKNTDTNTHASNSLLSLMCFQSSRLEARKDGNGDMVLLSNQNEDLWDAALIEKGFQYLQIASQWEITSKYYLEASIAYWHTVKNTESDKWEHILKLYDALIVLEPSPVIALNRLLALSKVKGELVAIQEAEKLNLINNHFYYLLLAELYKKSNPKQTIACYQMALQLCKNKSEKKFIETQLQEFIEENIRNLGS